MFEKGKLRRAIEGGDIETVKALIARKPALLNMRLHECSGRPLTLALQTGHPDMIKVLHEAGAEVTQRGDYGSNMLFDAVYYGHLEILKTWADQYKRIMNDTAYWGQTLLHIAAENGRADVVLWLLEDQGFDSEKTDERGRTAFFYAEKNNHDRVIAILKPLQEHAWQEYRAAATRLLGPSVQDLQWKKLDNYRIALVREDSLIGYRTTEIFNFAAGDRTRLYRNLETKAEAVESRLFVDIGAAGAAEIELARAALEAAGGKPPDMIGLVAPRITLGKRKA